MVKKMETISDDKKSLNLSKWLIFGGTFALINTILLAISFIQEKPSDMFKLELSLGTLIFCGVHSIITLVSGILLENKNKIGYYMLITSLIMTIAGFFINASTMNITFIKASISLYVILLSFGVFLLGLLPPFIVSLVGIPVLAFTIIFLFSIIYNIVNLKYWKNILNIS